MAASYPLSTRVFVRNQDRVDVVEADDVNDLQDEVAAIENVLGHNPHISEAFPTAQTVAERLTLGEGQFDTYFSGPGGTLPQDKVTGLPTALTNLTTALNTETSDRANGDAALDARLDVVEVHTQVSGSDVIITLQDGDTYARVHDGGGTDRYVELVGLRVITRQNSGGDGMLMGVGPKSFVGTPEAKTNIASARQRVNVFTSPAQDYPSTQIAFFSMSLTGTDATSVFDVTIESYEPVSGAFLEAVNGRQQGSGTVTLQLSSFCAAGVTRQYSMFVQRVSGTGTADATADTRYNHFELTVYSDNGTIP